MSFLICFAADGRDITYSDARKAAELFFQKQGEPATRSASLTLVEWEPATKTATAAPIYIFNRTGGGFVIVSGVDGAYPVLAWSATNSFISRESAPDNVRWWIDSYVEQIRQWRLTSTDATAEQKSRWDDALTLTRALTAGETIELGTPTWGQGDPFNRECPLDTLGKRSLVGCVAVALSQLCYYYKHPVSGKGTVPSYQANGLVIPDNTLGRTYNYSGMLSHYSGARSTTAQKNAVAALCYDVATVSCASFHSSSTGANSREAIWRMSEYMGFDKGVERNSRDARSAQEWKDIIKAEVDAGCPLVFTGTSTATGGSHAFLIDGYDSEDRFALNFGWNGSDNGFYQIDAFGAYTKSQVVYTGVKPDAGGSEQNYLSLEKRSYSSGREYNGINYYSGTIKPGYSFTVLIGTIVSNSLNTEFNGCVGFALESKNGTRKCWVRDSLEISSSSYASNATLKIPYGTVIEQGDVIKIYYKESGAKVWREFAFNDEDGSIMSDHMPVHIADRSSVTVEKGGRVLNVRTMANTTYKLVKGTSGSTIKSGTASQGQFKLDMSSYSSGVYTLTLTYGSSYSIQIVI